MQGNYFNHLLLLLLNQYLQLNDINDSKTEKLSVITCLYLYIIYMHGHATGSVV